MMAPGGGSRDSGKYVSGHGGRAKNEQKKTPEQTGESYTNGEDTNREMASQDSGFWVSGQDYSTLGARKKDKVETKEKKQKTTKSRVNQKAEPSARKVDQNRDPLASTSGVGDTPRNRVVDGMNKPQRPSISDISTISRKSDRTAENNLHAGGAKLEETQFQHHLNNVIKRECLTVMEDVLSTALEAVQAKTKVLKRALPDQQIVSAAEQLKKKRQLSPASSMGALNLVLSARHSGGAGSQTSDNDNHHPVDGVAGVPGQWRRHRTADDNDSDSSSGTKSPESERRSFFDRQDLSNTEEDLPEETVVDDLSCDLLECSINGRSKRSHNGSDSSAEVYEISSVKINMSTRSYVRTPVDQRTAGFATSSPSVRSSPPPANTSQRPVIRQPRLFLPPAAPQSAFDASARNCRCPRCSSVWQTELELEEHYFEHLTGNVSCGVGGCEYACSSRNGLRAHIRAAHLHNHTCRICGKAYLMASSLERHLRVHAQSRRCPLCPRACVDDAELCDHVARAHGAGQIACSRRPQLKYYVCKDCRFATTSHTVALDHCQSHILDKINLNITLCEICDLIFITGDLHFLMHVLDDNLTRESFQLIDYDWRVSSDSRRRLESKFKKLKTTKATKDKNEDEVIIARSKVEALNGEANDIKAPSEKHLEGQVMDNAVEARGNSVEENTSLQENNNIRDLNQNENDVVNITDGYINNENDQIKLNHNNILNESDLSQLGEKYDKILDPVGIILTQCGTESKNQLPNTTHEHIVDANTIKDPVQTETLIKTPLEPQTTVGRSESTNSINNQNEKIKLNYNNEHNESDLSLLGEKLDKITDLLEKYFVQRGTDSKNQSSNTAQREQLMDADTMKDPVQTKTLVKDPFEQPTTVEGSESKDNMDNNKCYELPSSLRAEAQNQNAALDESKCTDGDQTETNVEQTADHRSNHTTESVNKDTNYTLYSKKTTNTQDIQVNVSNKIHSDVLNNKIDIINEIDLRKNTNIKCNEISIREGTDISSIESRGILLDEKTTTNDYQDNEIKGNSTRITNELLDETEGQDNHAKINCLACSTENFTIDTEDKSEGDIKSKIITNATYVEDKVKGSSGCQNIPKIYTRTVNNQSEGKHTDNTVPTYLSSLKTEKSDNLGESVDETYSATGAHKTGDMKTNIQIPTGTSSLRERKCDDALIEDKSANNGRKVICNDVASTTKEQSDDVNNNDNVEYLGDLAEAQAEKSAVKVCSPFKNDECRNVEALVNENKRKSKDQKTLNNDDAVTTKKEHVMNVQNQNDYKETNLYESKPPAVDQAYKNNNKTSILKREVGPQQQNSIGEPQCSARTLDGTVIVTENEQKNEVNTNQITENKCLITFSHRDIKEMNGQVSIDRLNSKNNSTAESNEIIKVNDINIKITVSLSKKPEKSVANANSIKNKGQNSAVEAERLTRAVEVFEHMACQESQVNGKTISKTPACTTEKNNKKEVVLEKGHKITGEETKSLASTTEETYTKEVTIEKAKDQTGNGKPKSSAKTTEKSKTEVVVNKEAQNQFSSEETKSSPIITKEQLDKVVEQTSAQCSVAIIEENNREDTSEIKEIKKLENLEKAQDQIKTEKAMILASDKNTKKMLLMSLDQTSVEGTKISPSPTEKTTSNEVFKKAQEKETVRSGNPTEEPGSEDISEKAQYHQTNKAEAKSLRRVTEKTVTEEVLKKAKEKENVNSGSPAEEVSSKDISEKAQYQSIKAEAKSLGRVTEKTITEEVLKKAQEKENVNSGSPAEEVSSKDISEKAQYQSIKAEAKSLGRVTEKAVTEEVLKKAQEKENVNSGSPAEEVSSKDISEKAQYQSIKAEAKSLGRLTEKAVTEEVLKKTQENENVNSGSPAEEVSSKDISEKAQYQSIKAEAKSLGRVTEKAVTEEVLKKTQENENVNSGCPAEEASSKDISEKAQYQSIKAEAKSLGRVTEKAVTEEVLKKTQENENVNSACPAEEASSKDISEKAQYQSIKAEAKSLGRVTEKTITEEVLKKAQEKENVNSGSPAEEVSSKDISEKAQYQSIKAEAKSLGRLTEKAVTEEVLKKTQENENVNSGSPAEEVSSKDISEKAQYQSIKAEAKSLGRLTEKAVTEEVLKKTQENENVNSGCPAEEASSKDISEKAQYQSIKAEAKSLGRVTEKAVTEEVLKKTQENENVNSGSPAEEVSSKDISEKAQYQSIKAEAKSLGRVTEKTITEEVLKKAQEKENVNSGSPAEEVSSKDISEKAQYQSIKAEAKSLGRVTEKAVTEEVLNKAQEKENVNSGSPAEEVSSKDISEKAQYQSIKAEAKSLGRVTEKAVTEEVLKKTQENENVNSGCPAEEASSKDISEKAQYQSIKAEAKSLGRVTEKTITEEVLKKAQEKENVNSGSPAEEVSSKDISEKAQYQSIKAEAKSLGRVTEKTITEEVLKKAQEKENVNSGSPAEEVSSKDISEKAQYQSIKAEAKSLGRVTEKAVTEEVLKKAQEKENVNSGSPAEEVSSKDISEKAQYQSIKAEAKSLGRVTEKAVTEEVLKKTQENENVNSGSPAEEVSSKDISEKAQYQSIKAEAKSLGRVTEKAVTEEVLKKTQENENVNSGCPAEEVSSKDISEKAQYQSIKAEAKSLGRVTQKAVKEEVLKKTQENENVNSGSPAEEVSSKDISEKAQYQSIKAEAKSLGRVTEKAVTEEDLKKTHENENVNSGCPAEEASSKDISEKAQYQSIKAEAKSLGRVTEKAVTEEDLKKTHENENVNSGCPAEEASSNDISEKAQYQSIKAEAKSLGRVTEKAVTEEVLKKTQEKENVSSASTAKEVSSKDISEKAQYQSVKAEDKSLGRVTEDTDKVDLENGQQSLQRADKAKNSKKGRKKKK